MSKFPELMNDLAKIKNESITILKEISNNDNKIYKLIDDSVYNLECSLDVCNNPNREVQLPFTKIYTDNITHSEDDKLMKKVIDKFHTYKKSFEESSINVSELVKKCRERLSGMKKPVEDIKSETDESYQKFKEAIDILAQPLSNVIEGFEVEEFRKKDFKEEKVLSKLENFLKELKETFNSFRTVLNNFKDSTLKLFNNVTETNNSFSGFIETKMLEKIKEVPELLNKGISLLPEVAKKINEFNKSHKGTDQKAQSEKEDFFDKSLTEVLKMTKTVDDQIYNSTKSIESNFDDLNSKVHQGKEELEKNAEAYNNYVKDLKTKGQKIIDIINEIRKLFELEPVKLKFDNKDIKYPFYEYAKKLNKGFEEIQEIKKEVQKPMKEVMKVFGEQINLVTLDLLFIMDITESMQDLLEETRYSIKYILDKIKRDSPGIDVRFAYEGYRDFEDLKNGEKYYQIDFETDLNIFKKKLDEITCIGGGDDAEDVAGGLNAGLNMSWRSNARYAILIADAPGHGQKYHDEEVQDDYLKGDPNGLVIEDLMQKYADKSINLCLTKIDTYTDIMFNAMIKSFNEQSAKSKDKPKIEIINYDLDDDTLKKAPTKVKGQSQMGDLVAKTAINIYNQYSKKQAISSE